ncbi:hypothetical protein [Hymenobacter negativus]|uniref:SCP2 domain-containing protein n=1 Tax=Hymenobacter negativus TaxID=2795026 RepID=A0ABS3QFH5_9BACT|nr:hypothetical protein [Hymenobacter negativus]MBO2009922.1 hypothetical protein [Hymenobacter negativus]
MKPLPLAAPGFTDMERSLLQAMFDELAGFITADWEQRLPFTVGRFYMLERLGNPVQLVLRLTRPIGKMRNPEEIDLWLNVNIQGTSAEKWVSAKDSFFLSQGPAAQVTAAIHSFQADIHLVQAQLAQHYYGTFYNS